MITEGVLGAVVIFGVSAYCGFKTADDLRRKRLLLGLLGAVFTALTLYSGALPLQASLYPPGVSVSRVN